MGNERDRTSVAGVVVCEDHLAAGICQHPLTDTESPVQKNAELVARPEMGGVGSSATLCQESQL